MTRAAAVARRQGAQACGGRGAPRSRRPGAVQAKATARPPRRSVSSAAASSPWAPTAVSCEAPTRTPTPAEVRPDAALSPPVLLSGYSTVIEAMLEEIRTCGPGDLLTMSIYVVEPGASTNLMLRALREAAARGVRLDLQCDASITSHVTRFFEGTKTEAKALQSIAADFPITCSFTPQTIPTHAKYIICQRGDAPSSAIFGGVNVGDRFGDWRDFAVRIRGDQLVRRLAASVCPEMSNCEACDDVYSHAGSDALGLVFCCNHPSGIDLPAWFLGRQFPGTFHVRPALASIFSDHQVEKITVAMAYIDSDGAELLRLALRRGAKLKLVMPRHPNVYQSCNSATLRSLVREWGGPSGPLSVSLHRDMLHAKALVAEKSDGSSIGLVGSCNFKCRSFGQFAELCALSGDQTFNNILKMEISALVVEAERVSCQGDLPHFDPTVATLEQWLG